MISKSMLFVTLLIMNGFITWQFSIVIAKLDAIEAKVRASQPLS